MWTKQTKYAELLAGCYYTHTGPSYASWFLLEILFAEKDGGLPEVADINQNLLPRQKMGHRQM